MTFSEIGKTEYFYNMRTKMVEKGRQSSWEDLLGPYETREEAEQAPQIAKERNAEWKEDDDAWQGEDS